MIELPATGSTPWGVRLPDPVTDDGAASPALLMPVFRSEAQARLLAELFVDPDPDIDYGVAQLAELTGVHLRTVQQEISELVEARLLLERAAGDDRYVHVPRHDPRRDTLVGLLRGSYGVKPLLQRGLSGIPGIDVAYLHGTWAARYCGFRGSPPPDIDLLVVGRPDHGAIYRVVDEVERKIDTQLNAVILLPETWNAAAEPFTRGVRNGPHVRLRREL